MFAISGRRSSRNCYRWLYHCRRWNVLIDSATRSSYVRGSLRNFEEQSEWTNDGGTDRWWLVLACTDEINEGEILYARGNSARDLETMDHTFNPLWYGDFGIDPLHSQFLFHWTRYVSWIIYGRKYNRTDKRRFSKELLLHVLAHCANKLQRHWEKIDFRVDI